MLSLERQGSRLFRCPQNDTVLAVVIVVNFRQTTLAFPRKESFIYRQQQRYSQARRLLEDEVSAQVIKSQKR